MVCARSAPPSRPVASNPLSQEPPETAALDPKRSFALPRNRVLSGSVAAAGEIRHQMECPAQPGQQSRLVDTEAWRVVGRRGTWVLTGRRDTDPKKQTRRLPREIRKIFGG